MRGVVTYYVQEWKGKGNHCDSYISRVQTYSSLHTVLCCAGHTHIPWSNAHKHLEKKGNLGFFPLISEQQIILTRDAETGAEIKKKNKHYWQIVFLNFYFILSINKVSCLFLNICSFPLPELPESRGQFWWAFDTQYFWKSTSSSWQQPYWILSPASLLCGES